MILYIKEKIDINKINIKYVITSTTTNCSLLREIELNQIRQWKYIQFYNHRNLLMPASTQCITKQYKTSLPLVYLQWVNSLI